jgi:hypothetical protein
VTARTKHRLHLYRRARRTTALLLGGEIVCCAVALALLRVPVDGRPAGVLRDPALAALPRLAAVQGVTAAGWLAAFGAVGFLLPIAVLLRHLIGSRRGPLVDIAVGFAAVAVALEAMAIGCWLLVLPDVASTYASAPAGTTGEAAAGIVSRADVLLVAGTVVALANAAFRLGGFFTAVWVWFLAAMVIASGRLPSWPGRVGVMVALLLAVAAVTGSPAAALAAVLGLQCWFALLIVVVLRQAYAVTAATADAVPADAAMDTAAD